MPKWTLPSSLTGCAWPRLNIRATSRRCRWPSRKSGSGRPRWAWRGSTAWAAQQLIESFPEESAPTYLLRDRDAIYGDVFARRVKALGMSEILIAPRAPWQNPYAERLIGSIRRECLDHVIVINERHLRRLLRSYLAYYNATRPHQSLDNDSPRRREAQSVLFGCIVTIPEVGGLHHRYHRAA